MTFFTLSFYFINREIIIFVFQLQEFLINDHFYVNLLNKNIRQLINHIVRNNFRPSLIFKEIKIFIKNERSRVRFNLIKLSF